MYLDYQLATNPSFRMTREDFNSLVNSLTDTPTPTTKPVEVGVVYRTETTNKVATTGDNVLFRRQIDKTETQGYFEIINSVQKLTIELFGDIPFNAIKETVLMPIGAFETEGVIIIYFNLILKDNVVEVFNTNPLVDFVPINEVLNTSYKRDIIILPTLTQVRN